MERDISDQLPQEFHPDEPLQAPPAPMDNPTFEKVARRLEEEDLYAHRFKQAKLTRVEETAIRLRLQGHSVQEIAAMMQKRLNATQQDLRRAQKKLLG